LTWTECRDTRQPNPAVTAFGLGGEFLEVVVYEFSTGGLYDAAAVGGGVVGSAFAEGDALGHWWLILIPALSLEDR